MAESTIVMADPAGFRLSFAAGASDNGVIPWNARQGPSDS